MNKINFLKPDKSNLNLFLILGLSLVFISIFDVFLSSFLKINATAFLPTSISFLLPFIIGFIGLYFIRIEYSGIKRLDDVNKNFNNSKGKFNLINPNDNTLRRHQGDQYTANIDSKLPTIEYMSTNHNNIVLPEN